MAVPKILGKKIKSFRKKMGLTQEELADKVNLTSTYIGFIEQGRYSPSLKTAQKIAKVLKVSLSDLFSR